MILIAIIINYANYYSWELLVINLLKQKKLVFDKLYYDK